MTLAAVGAATISQMPRVAKRRRVPLCLDADRRLVKAINMLRVAAYCDGRTEVSEADCLLLQHVLWQRPEEAERIYDYLLKQLR